MTALARELGADDAFIRHSHTSKSMALPVATYRWENGLEFAIRDNFHDINLFVKAKTLIDIPLDFLHARRDFAWYLEEINRKQRYCFRDWSPAEIEDPRILRVPRKNGNGWDTRSPDEKDRWADRMSSTAWYNCDWSSSTLLTVGPTPFDETTKFFHMPHAYAEGIPELAEPYTGPCNKFILSLTSWGELVYKSKLILDHVKENTTPVTTT